MTIDRSTRDGAEMTRARTGFLASTAIVAALFISGGSPANAANACVSDYTTPGAGNERGWGKCTELNNNVKWRVVMECAGIDPDPDKRTGWFTQTSSTYKYTAYCARGQYSWVQVVGV